MLHHIPIMFDVQGADRTEAASAIVEALAAAGFTGAVVESWWTIDGRDKAADRNDNDHGTVVWGES